MTEIAAARIDLHEQLVRYLSDVLAPERIHLYTPTIIASPCVWIAQPGVDTNPVGGNGAKVRAVSFDIFMVPDGYEPEQCALLDEMVARVSDAIYDLPRTSDGGANPQPVDVGGTTVRCVVQNAAMSVFGHSLCKRNPPAVPQPQGVSR